LLALGLTAGISVLSLYAMVIRPTSPIRNSEHHPGEAEGAPWRPRVDIALCRLRTSAKATPRPNFQLLPYLETLLEKHGLDKNVVNMAPDNLQL
jgi:hypothetical protein